MKTFTERLVGKSVEKIEGDEFQESVLIQLSDRSGFRVYTEVSATLVCRQSKVIERVTIDDEKIILHLKGISSVTIYIDPGRFPDILEFFVYSDDDGYVVEN